MKFILLTSISKKDFTYLLDRIYKEAYRKYKDVLLEIYMVQDQDNLIHERRVATLFDLTSLIAGIPNFLIIIFSLLISNFQDFNSVFIMVEKLCSKS